MKLAEAIKEQRELKGWSQEELANILKVSRQSVSKWESAKNYPSIVDFLYDFWWLFFPVAGFLVWAIHSFMG